MRKFRLLYTTTSLSLLLGVSVTCAAPVLNLGNGPSSANSQSPIGMNLQMPSSYSPDPLFIDAALKGRNWIPHDCPNVPNGKWDNKTSITTDSQGWVTGVVPGTCPGMVVLDENLDSRTNDTLHYVALGSYIMIWEGEGTLNLNVVASPRVFCKSSGCKRWSDERTVQSTGPGPHRATFELTNPASTFTDLRILSFSPARPIKNIRIIAPGGHIVDQNGNLDYFSYCKTARGPNGPAPTGAMEFPPRNSTCRDFSDSFWDRYTDALGTAHKSTKVNDRRSPPKAMLHPLTLQNLKNARMIRAMDWMHTNDSTVSSWLQRTNYKHQNQVESEHGVAIEYLVTLANVLGSDLWVNVPHLADQNYSASLANFLFANFNSKLKVYVEYSNELWNEFTFGQGRWILAQARVQYPDESDVHLAALWTQTDYAKAVADQFDRIYRRNTGRLVHVLSGQAVNIYSANELLVHADAYARFNAFAIAPYFGVNISDPNNVFGQINDTALPLARTWVTDNSSIVAGFTAPRPRLIAYEGGQHLGAWVDALGFATANRSESMKTATSNYLQIMKDAGLEEMAYYNDVGNYTTFGYWGARETLTDTTAPKWNAINEFINNNGCWWPGCIRN